MNPTHRGLLVLVSWLAAGGVAQAVVNPPVLKWQNGSCSGGCQTGWYSSPAVADLDNDGLNEVVYGSYDVVVLNGQTGAVRARATNGSRVWPGVAIADLTGDGSKEIIVGRGSNQVTVYRFVPPSTLQVVWTRNPFVNNCSGNGCEVRTLAVEDLESDGQLEVIVGRGSGGSFEQLNVYDANGNQRAGWPARRNGEVGFGWGMYNENVTVGDLNGDGFKEIIGPTDTHYITALDRNGNQLPTNAMFNNYNPQGPKPWSRVGVHVDLAADLAGFADCGVQHRPNFANSAPAIADVNGDGVGEIIVVGDVYNCDIGDPEGDLYHMPWILRLDRSRWAGSGYDWTVLPSPEPGSAPLSQDYDVIENSVQNVVVADLDNDGLKEILYPSYDGRLHAYWLDKTQRGAWPYDIPGAGIRFASEPVVADIDADGQAEVIFTSWAQKTGGFVGQLHILSSMGAQLQVLNLPAIGTANGGLAAPTLANIDADADLEIVVGTIRSGAVAYDLPGSASARVLWGTGRGSNKRTGVALAAFASLTPATTTVGEGAGSVTVSVRVTTSDGAPTPSAATVNYATADGSALAGSDYTTRAGTFNIPAGTASGAVLAVTNVPILEDAVSEGNQSFSIGLSVFTNIVSGPVTVETITITDNEASPQTSEVYRLRHPSIGAYLFTIYSTERDSAAATFGYVYEGLCCSWFNTPAGDGRTGLFRLYSGTAGEYFFTISTAERNAAVAQFGYVYEGVSAYCYPSSSPTAPRPWFRLRYGNKHFYTVYPEERDSAVALGFVYEGISCYLPPP